MQEGTANSGLQTNANADISIADAVSGITKLRDNLAGTSAENALTRNTVAQGGATSTTGPDLFAADSDAIAFTRTPSQVTLSFPNLLHLHCDATHRADYTCQIEAIQVHKPSVHLIQSL